MCNCIAEVTEKYKKMAVELGNEIIGEPKMDTSIDNKNEKTTYTIIRHKCKFKGKIAEKGIQLYHQYCPFCGEKKGGDE